MPLISHYSRTRKLERLVALIEENERVLEIGSGDGWVVEQARAAGIEQYFGLDLNAGANYVGDIKRWRELGIEPESFDFIVGFEVVEHVHCFREMFDILRPGGRLFLTSPVPHWD